MYSDGFRAYAVASRIAWPSVKEESEEGVDEAQRNCHVDRLRCCFVQFVIA